MGALRARRWRRSKEPAAASGEAQGQEGGQEIQEGRTLARPPVFDESRLWFGYLLAPAQEAQGFMLERFCGQSVDR